MNQKFDFFDLLVRHPDAFDPENQHFGSFDHLNLLCPDLQLDYQDLFLYVEHYPVMTVDLICHLFGCFDHFDFYS